MGHMLGIVWFNLSMTFTFHIPENYEDVQKLFGLTMIDQAKTRNNKAITFFLNI